MNITKRLIRLIVGWFLFALGILGLFLPILQGWLFIAIATILLAQDVPFFKRIWQYVQQRFPKVARKADKITNNLEDELPG